MSAINKINVDNVSYNIEDSRVDNIADAIPTASTEQKGLVLIGQGINVDANGVISVEASGGDSVSYNDTSAALSSSVIVGYLNINGTDYTIAAPYTNYSNGVVTTNNTVLGTINNGSGGAEYDIVAPAVSYDDYTQGTNALGVLIVGDNQYPITYTPAASGDSVQFNSLLASGTQIGTITINGVDTAIYAPAGGSGGGSSVSYRDNTSPEDQHRTVIGELTIDGAGYYIYVPSTISVDWNNIINTPIDITRSLNVTPTLASGTKIAEIACYDDEQGLRNTDIYAPEQVQANWNEADSSSKAYIANKPTIPTATSQLINDSDFVIGNNLATVATTGNYNDLTNKPTIPAVIGDVSGLAVTPDLSSGTKIATIAWTDGSGANTQDLYAPAGGGSSVEPHFEVEIYDDQNAGLTEATVYYVGDPMVQQVGGEFWNDPNFIKACNNPAIITRTDYTFKTIGIATFDTMEGYILWITLANPTYGTTNDAGSIAIGRLAATLAWDDVNNELVFESVNLLKSYDSTEVESLLQTGTPIANIKTNNNTTTIYAPAGGSGGDTVTVTQTVTSGTKIADIDVSGTTTELYAPAEDDPIFTGLQYVEFRSSASFSITVVPGAGNSEVKWDGTLEYYDGGSISGDPQWREISKDESSVVINANSANTYYYIRLRGRDNTYITGQPESGVINPDTKFTLAADGIVYSYGNIMSLLDYRTSSTNKIIPAPYAFYAMFKGWMSLYTAPELPATKLANYCYGEMFMNSGICIVPELPATELANYCYQNMFRNCGNITDASIKLPAQVLKTACYYGMFEECINLTKAPAILATSVDYNCCAYMFQQCTSLKKAPKLSCEGVSNSCYQYMFYQCSNLIEAPELPATALSARCYQNMFAYCTSLVVPPVLPATTLADYCYYGMFQHCTSLAYIPEVPATRLYEGCYQNMFADSGVSISQTLTDEYNLEFRIPKSGTGTAPTINPPMNLMFTNMVPQINTTYYAKAIRYADYGYDKDSHAEFVEPITKVLDTVAGNSMLPVTQKAVNTAIANAQAPDWANITNKPAISAGTGTAAIREGNNTTAAGNHSHAEGNSSNASGNYSHAEGYYTTASGSGSHTEGGSTSTIGEYSHAEGRTTVAGGACSHAEGRAANASGDYSHAEGYYTKTSSQYQHAQGKYNIEDSNLIFADIIGNGADDSGRSNAAALDWNGTQYLAGDLYVNCTDFTTTSNGLTTTNAGGTKVATLSDIKADWAITDASVVGYIANKPRIITSVNTSNILINTDNISITASSSRNVFINGRNFANGPYMSDNIIIGPNHRFDYSRGSQAYLIGNGLKVYGSWSMALGFYNVPETGKNCYSFILGDGFNDAHQHTALAFDASTHNAYFSDGIYVGCTDYTTTASGLTTLGAGGFRIDQAPESFDPTVDQSRTDKMIMVDSITYTKVDGEYDPDTGEEITPASYTAAHTREWKSLADLLTINLENAPILGVSNAGIYTLQIWGITHYDADGNPYVESEFRWVKTADTTPEDDPGPTPEEPDPEEEPTEEEPTE